MEVELPAAESHRAQLRRILDSGSFRNSDSLRRLLTYLADRALTHPSEELKEYVIGIEAFGKPESYDPQKDASVRVQIGRLREELEEYYKSEGARDPYRLVLPKGHFTIVFERQGVDAANAAGAAPTAVRKVSGVRIGLVAALVLLAASLLWAFALWRKVGQLESHLVPASPLRDMDVIWGAFLKPDVPRLVVFGSPPFFASTTRDMFVRMYRAVNPDDPRSSAAYREVDTKLGPLQGPRYDYASMGDAIGVQRLTAFFGSQGRALQALPAHLAAWETIEGANLIFIGAARMNPLLRRLPIQQDFEIGSDNYIHNRNPQPGEQSVYETPSHRDSMSYAVVGSFAGLTPGREIVVLAAHSTPATVGAVDFITSVDGVRLIRDKLKLQPGEHRHFQLLLRVFTDNDSPVKTEYVTHHLLP